MGEPSLTIWPGAKSNPDIYQCDRCGDIWADRPPNSHTCADESELCVCWPDNHEPGCPVHREQT